MNINLIDIGVIKPYKLNAKKHPQSQIDGLRSSINKFGFTQPIVIDKDNEIIIGHGRFEAAKAAGLKQVPIVKRDDLSPNEVKALRLIDNRIAETGWDGEMLGLDLADIDFDFNPYNVSFDDLVELPEVEGLTDPDAIPENVEPRTKLGDLYQLGDHTLICGDCTLESTWDSLKLVDGVVCVTSPPYLLGDSFKLSGNKSKNKDSPYLEKEVSNYEYVNLLQRSFDNAINYCEGVAFNLQILAKSKTVILNFINSNERNLNEIITWDKGHAAPAMAEGVCSSRYEWILVFSKSNNRRIPLSGWRGTISNIYIAPPQRNNEFANVHGATFPCHLPLFISGDLMNRSRGLVDCFCGTGTSLIAAEKLGKKGYGIEIDPRYCDIIIKRWEDFTGKKAELVS